MGLTWVAQRFIATSAGHLARIYLVMHGNSYRSVQAAQRSADLLTTMITKLLSLWRNIAVEATVKVHISTLDPDSISICQFYVLTIIKFYYELKRYVFWHQFLQLF